MSPQMAVSLFNNMSPKLYIHSGLPQKNTPKPIPIQSTALFHNKNAAIKTITQIFYGWIFIFLAVFCITDRLGGVFPKIEFKQAFALAGNIAAFF